MRVLVTDVATEPGRTLARRLLAAGHDVVGLATSRHRCLDPSVELISGRASNPSSLLIASAGCDCVVHVDAHHARGQVSAVGAAARSAGARLLLVVEGGPGIPSEALRGTGADSLLIRTAPLVGRRADRSAFATIAGLLRSRSQRPWQVLHHDDLDRFLVLAVGDDRTGVVELAAQGTVTPTDARWILSYAGATRRPWVRPARQTPYLDTSAATECWDFHPAWSAQEAVADLARGLVGRSARGARPRRLRRATPRTSRSAAAG